MLRFEQQYSLQGNLMRAFFVYDRRNRVVALGAVSVPNSPGFCAVKGKKRESDASLVAAVEKITGLRVRLHEWVKGVKGCPKVARRLNPEVA